MQLSCRQRPCQRHSRPFHNLSTLCTARRHQRLGTIFLLLLSTFGDQNGRRLLAAAAASSSSSSSSRRHRHKARKRSKELSELPSCTLYDDESSSASSSSSLGYCDVEAATEDIFFPVGFGYLPLNDEYFDSIEEESTEYDMEAERVLSALERIQEEQDNFVDEDDEEERAVATSSSSSLELSEEVQSRRKPSTTSRRTNGRRRKRRRRRRSTQQDQNSQSRQSSGRSQSYAGNVDDQAGGTFDGSVGSVMFNAESQSPSPFQQKNVHALETQEVSASSYLSQQNSIVSPELSSQQRRQQQQKQQQKQQQLPLPTEITKNPLPQNLKQTFSSQDLHTTHSASAARLLPRGGLSTTDPTLTNRNLAMPSSKSVDSNRSTSALSMTPSAAMIQPVDMTSSANMAASSSSMNGLSRQPQMRLPVVDSHRPSTPNLGSDIAQTSAGLVAPKASMPSTQSLSSTSTAASTTSPWIRKFLGSRPKDVLLPVPKDFLSDGFNLAQLAPIVERIGLEAWARDVAVQNENDSPGVADSDRKQSMTQQQFEEMDSLLLPDRSIVGTSSHPIYRQALRFILQESRYNGSESSVEKDGSSRGQQSTAQGTTIPPAVIQQAAEALYLMVHARFVTSPRGLDTVRRILSATTISSRSRGSNSQQSHQHQAFLEPAFGRCPRTSCDGMPLLPCGDSNDYCAEAYNGPKKATISKKCKRYCACCQEYFYFWDSKTDGCAWGPSFCHLFLMAHGDQVFPDILQKRKMQQLLLQIETHRTKSFEDTSPKSDAANAEHSHSVMGFRIHPSTVWGK